MLQHCFDFFLQSKLGSSSLKTPCSKLLTNAAGEVSSCQSSVFLNLRLDWKTTIKVSPFLYPLPRAKSLHCQNDARSSLCTEVRVLRRALGKKKNDSGGWKFVKPSMNHSALRSADCSYLLLWVVNLQRSIQQAKSGLCGFGVILCERQHWSEQVNNHKRQKGLQ